MKRSIALFITLGMMLSVLAWAGCGDTPAVPTTTASSTTAETTAATTTAEETTAETTDSTTTASEETTAQSISDGTTDIPPEAETTTADTGAETPIIDLSGFDGYTKLPGYEDVDFGGRTFTLGLHDGGNEIMFYSEGTTVRDVAVRKRNDLMEQLYNCKIVFSITSSPATLVNADVTGNTHNIDYYMTQYPSSSTAINKQNYNLYNLGINFENPWWTKAYVDTYTIDKNGTPALYGAYGEFCGIDSTYSLFYNIDVYNQSAVCKQYDIYQLVRDKKWTMDIFVEMIKDIKRDTNGNSVYSYQDGDIMGWIRTQHASHAMHAASNLKIFENVNGKLSFAPAARANEWSDVITKAIEVYATEGTQVVSYTYIPDYVASGKALFFSETLGTVRNMADMDIGIGLVPYPMYSESQENYCNYVDNHIQDWHIPVSVPNPETIAIFAELLACHSSYIVYPATIDQYTVELFGDEESAEMLDIIVKNATYDPGYLWWSNFEADVGNMIAGGKNNATQWASKKEPDAKKKITEFMTGLLANEN